MAGANVRILSRPAARGDRQAACLAGGVATGDERPDTNARGLRGIRLQPDLAAGTVSRSLVARLNT